MASSAVTTKWSSYHRDHIAWKAQHICCLVLYRKSLLTNKSQVLLCCLQRTIPYHQHVIFVLSNIWMGYHQHKPKMKQRIYIHNLDGKVEFLSSFSIPFHFKEVPQKSTLYRNIIIPFRGCKVGSLWVSLRTANGIKLLKLYSELKHLSFTISQCINTV